MRVGLLAKSRKFFQAKICWFPGNEVGQGVMIVANRVEPRFLGVRGSGPWSLEKKVLVQTREDVRATEDYRKQDRTL